MKLVKIILPVVILGIAILLGKQIRNNPPEASSRPSFASLQAVEATTLKAQSYQVVLSSQGTVEPSTANTLVAEVAGTIQSVSPSFVSGGEFKQGDVLIQLDERDYQIALTQANAQLAQAEAQLQEELARGAQAKVEWESLHRKRKPTPLNLRKPQAAAARANRDAAASQVERARLDLQRTQIIAPYDGLVSQAQTNLGQFVGRGNMLGEIYSVKSMDVRLPLTSRQQALLKSVNDVSGGATKVLLDVAGKPWPASLVRVEGIDTNTQQYNVIARVQLPLDKTLLSLRSGQYVKANIDGQTLANVFVVPRTAVREGSEVLLLIEGKTIERKPVEVVWRDQTHSIINAGLNEGQVLVTTSLPIVANGTPVLATVDGVKPKRPGRPEGAGKGKPNGAGKGKPEGAGKGKRPGKPDGAAYGANKADGKKPEGKSKQKPAKTGNDS